MDGACCTCDAIYIAEAVLLYVVLRMCRGQTNFGTSTAIRVANPASIGSSDKKTARLPLLQRHSSVCYGNYRDVLRQSTERSRGKGLGE